MRLEVSEDRRIFQQTLDRFLGAESDGGKIRAAEPLGFDPALWRKMAEFGLLGLRAPEAAGGSGLSLLDGVLAAEQTGRHLVSGPVVEAIVAIPLLAAAAPEDPLLAKAIDGEAIVVLALKDIRAEPDQLVPGAAVADAILGLRGQELVMFRQAPPMSAPDNLGGLPLAALPQAEPQVLAAGADAARLYGAALEEWKLLTAAAMAAAAHRAVENAARYSCDRIVFGKPIGAYQAVSHALADAAAEVEGAQLLARWCVHALAREATPQARAAIPMAFWWAATAGARAVEKALHVHGGYGLAVEYDPHLYFRRVRGWGLLTGDPADCLETAARRLWMDAPAPLPQAGDPEIDFGYGAEAEALAQEVRDFFQRELTPELKARAHFSFEGHDWGLHRRMAEAGLLFPSWPKEHGGRNVDRYAEAAIREAWEEFDWTAAVQGVANIVAHIVMWFGSAELKAEVLPRIFRGEATCSLGFSEPQGGSDVFSARVRSRRDGDDWIIDGQKMWTSGAELADYVLLLTRTSTEGPKHGGLTVFMFPLKSPGVTITPIHTFQGERTNATFYDQVRIPDRYRLGEEGGGVAVMGASLKLEHGGGSPAACQKVMLREAVAWARTARRDGTRPMDERRVRERLARAAVHATVSDLLTRRALWASVEGGGSRAYGPMSKVFATEIYKTTSADLVDLTGGVLRGSGGLGRIEADHRRSVATTIYGGVSEVHRSMVAELLLGMPRSRS